MKSKNWMVALLLISGFSVYSCTNSKTIPPDGKDLTKNYFYNPILQSGPDPHVFLKDSIYYYMRTTGGNLTVWRTRKMSELKYAENKVIWTAPETGMWSSDIWAPEIYFLQGKWYIYFAADDGDNANHRMYIIENSSKDPFQGTWIFKGPIKPATDRWAIDGSVFEHNGTLYFLWSGWEGTENISQNIYIAEMENPWTIKGDRVLISKPEFGWETIGANSEDPPVNEGPVMLKGVNKLFIVFSASGCWTDDYCLGMLTASANANLLDPASWTKSAKPVFTKSVADGVFAPGHNGFFKTFDGKEDWIIFHANEKSGDGCGDSRKTRMQKITWRHDGKPYFGVPLSNDTPLKKPSGE